MVLAAWIGSSVIELRRKAPESYPSASAICVANASGSRPAGPRAGSRLIPTMYSQMSCALLAPESENGDGDKKTLRVLHVIGSLKQISGGPLRTALDISARSQAMGLHSEVAGFGVIDILR